MRLFCNVYGRAEVYVLKELLSIYGQFVYFPKNLKNPLYSGTIQAMQYSVKLRSTWLKYFCKFITFMATFFSNLILFFMA